MIHATSARAIRLSFSLLVGALAAASVAACANGDDVAFSGCVGETCPADTGHVGGDGGPDTGTIDPGTDTGAPPGDTGASMGDTGTTMTCSSGSYVCNTIPQCGCAAGENCDVTTVDGTRACVSAGSAGVHEVCTASGECKAGLTCIGGVCIPFCTSDSDCTGVSPAVCTQVQYYPSGGTTAMPVPDYQACYTQCDPMNAGDTCGPGNGCTFADETTTFCTSAGMGITAGDCISDASACAPGYFCSSGDCYPFCTTDSDCGDPSTYSCYPFDPTLTYAGTSYGYCDFAF